MTRSDLFLGVNCLEMAAYPSIVTAVRSSCTMVFLQAYISQELRKNAFVCSGAISTIHLNFKNRLLDLTFIYQTRRNALYDGRGAVLMPESEHAFVGLDFFHDRILVSCLAELWTQTTTS